MGEVEGTKFFFFFYFKKNITFKIRIESSAQWASTKTVKNSILISNLLWLNNSLILILNCFNKGSGVIGAKIGKISALKIYNMPTKLLNMQKKIYIKINKKKIVLDNMYTCLIFFKICNKMVDAELMTLIFWTEKLILVNNMN